MIIFLALAIYIGFSLISSMNKKVPTKKTVQKPTKQMKIEAVKKTLMDSTFGTGTVLGNVVSNSAPKKNNIKRNARVVQTAIEEYEDEEAYETELLTPMSQELDDGEVYSTNEWDHLTSFTHVTSNKTKRKNKKIPLRQAFIYSEVLGRPKGLQEDN